MDERLAADLHKCHFVQIAQQIAASNKYILMLNVLPSDCFQKAKNVLTLELLS